jgi:hypothetical protein
MPKRGFYRGLLLLIGFLFIGLVGHAQPGPPPDPDVPITGIEILLAIGGFLGIKKLLGKDKKNP